MAQGFALKPQTGFSANFPFQDPATFGDSKLEGAGVFVGHEGTAPGAPLFSGHLLIRNTSSDPLTASPVLQRGQFQQALAAVQLQPGEAREILVPADFLPDRPDATGIEIRHTGPAGGLIGYWFSVDPSGNLVVETPLRSHAPNLPGSGNNPWSLEGDLSSVLYLKNTGETRALSVLEIWHAQGEYMIGLKQIPAGETLALDLRRLRDDHIPDVNGRTLPPDLLAGQILWRWRAGPPLIGRVNTMSVSKGIASNMSCSGCCCTPASIQITLQPAGVAGPVGGSVQETVTETDTGTCGSPQTFPVDPSLLYWNSSNASVASVIAGSISCLSPGSTTVTGSRSDFLLTPIHDVTEECACNQIPVTPTGSSDVTVVPTVQITGGNNFVFVGSDPTVRRYNLQQAVGNPSGGMYSWSASNNRVSFDNPNTDVVQLTGISPSTGLLDTTLTVNYSVNGQSARPPAIRDITVRIFRFLQESGQLVIIPQSNGYIANQTYNIFTSPNRQMLQPGFGGITIPENVMLQSATRNGVPLTDQERAQIQNIRGGGSTNQNSQIVDDLSLLTTTGNPLPTGLVFISNQDIFVGGLFVRSNSIEQRSENIVIITNLGPF